ncbi:hypothetical protein V502_07646 [Pseudogymnoascus sp. VKM F-4520 (FW-2644)]|nr:hypothetical protein V502_07646 [Pseudogymnoascus sp. VKM F-4520 (FW-2644)]
MPIGITWNLDPVAASRVSRMSMVRQRNVFVSISLKIRVRVRFRTARKVDPAAKLYLNEYNNESGAKGDAFYNLAKELVKSGVPIDGVGIQGHYILGSVPTTLQKRMKALGDLGLDVAITELDIRIANPTTEAKLQQQAKDFEDVTKACLAVSKCVGITSSTFTDKYSWVPTTFEGFDNANPWNKNLEKKPAYHAISKAISSIDKRMRDQLEYVDLQNVELMRLDAWLSYVGRTDEISNGPHHLLESTPALVQLLMDEFEVDFQNTDLSAEEGGLQDIQVLAANVMDFLTDEELNEAEQLYVLVAFLRAVKVAQCLQAGPNTVEVLEILRRDIQAHLV